MAITNEEREERPTPITLAYLVGLKSADQPTTVSPDPIGRLVFTLRVSDLISDLPDTSEFYESVEAYAFAVRLKRRDF